MFYVYSRGDQRHNTPALFCGAIIYVQILKKCFLFLPLLITLYDKEKQVTFAPIGIDMNFYLIRPKTPSLTRDKALRPGKRGMMGRWM